MQTKNSEFIKAEETELNEQNLETSDTQISRRGNFSYEESYTLVCDLYNLILKRSPDPHGIETFVKPLSDGSITIQQIVQGMVSSSEFGDIAIRHTTVARVLAQSAVLAVTGSAPSEAAVDAYAAEMGNGYSLIEFLCELVNSNQRSIRSDFSTQHSLNFESAARTVTELYELVLRRAPDPEGIELHTKALLQGEFTPLDITRDLLSSKEFSYRTFLHDNVAKFLVESVIVTLMARHPGEGVIAAYSESIKNGYRITDFLSELISSEEFKTRMGINHQNVGMNDDVPYEISQLAESLVIARMVGDGCTISMPPHEKGTVSSTSKKQMQSLLKTMAMFMAVEPVSSSSRK